MMTFHHLSFRQPRPRHDERSLGEAIGVALGEGEAGERGPATLRSAAARRRAYAFVSARYGTRGVARAWRLALLGLMAVGVALTVWTLSGAGELAPLHDAPEAYETTATLAREACAAGACVFSDTAPSPLGEAMAQVGARRVAHNPVHGETILRGGRLARFDLVRSWTPTQVQIEARQARAGVPDRFVRVDAYAGLLDLYGSGWNRVHRSIRPATPPG